MRRSDYGLAHAAGLFSFEGVFLLGTAHLCYAFNHSGLASQKESPVNDNLLKPVDDGLPMRPNKEHATDKLRVLGGYIHRFITSMRERPWRAFFYIDLLAGPGKNRFPDGTVMFGSPLIALNSTYPFTNYRFVDFDPQNCEALRKRVSASEYENRVRIMHGDCNKKVDEIVSEIAWMDGVYKKGRWSCLSLAFLDPEGLELRWETVEKLGQMKHMDLIINFSTSGITRNAQQLIDSGNTESIDLFFGTEEWKKAYKEAGGDNTRVRRALLDLYKKRLGTLDYQVVEPSSSDELVFKNSKNVQLYTLIGVSKHERGVEFWQDTIAGKSSSSQLRMF